MQAAWVGVGSLGMPSTVRDEIRRTMMRQSISAWSGEPPEAPYGHGCMGLLHGTPHHVSHSSTDGDA
jgi:hypothetical protein